MNLRKIAAAVATAGLLVGMLPASAGAIVAGAGFTTNNPNADGDDKCLNGSPSSTPKVNCNLYEEKEHVWINGGPSNGANALSSGTYFFAVLEPGGQPDPNDGGAKNLSDTDASGGIDDSAGDAYTNREFTVATSGKIATNLGTHDDDSTYVSPNGLFIRLAPYDTTSNPGGVYILAICKISSTQATAPITADPVSPSDCKYDAFKVRGEGTVTNFGVVSGGKYYDANVNGQWDSGEVGISGWPIDYADGVSGTIVTGTGGLFSVALVADTYTFAEQVANSPWIQTGNTVDQTSATGGASATLNGDKSYTVTVVDDSQVDGIYFGNVCVGAGGGHTLGFWSNKNGHAQMNDGGTLGPEIALLNALHLANATGDQPDFTGSEAQKYSQFRSWLLNATAVNMAYMLSAQLAAMTLNIEAGFVDPAALVWNGSAFVSIGSVVAAAEAALTADQYTPDGDPNRSTQEALKNTLDAANNNQNFLQPGPGSCPTPVFPS